MDELSKKIVSMLKSNAYNSVLANTLSKIPIVITKHGAYNKKHDVYAIDLDNNQEYEDIDTLSNKEFKRRYWNRAFSWRGRKIIKRNMDILREESDD